MCRCSRGNIQWLGLRTCQVAESPTEPGSPRILRSKLSRTGVLVSHMCPHFLPLNAACLLIAGGYTSPTNLVNCLRSKKINKIVVAASNLAMNGPISAWNGPKQVAYITPMNSVRFCKSRSRWTVNYAGLKPSPMQPAPRRRFSPTCLARRQCNRRYRWAWRVTSVGKPTRSIGSKPHFAEAAEAADAVQAYFGASAEKGLALFDLLRPPLRHRRRQPALHGLQEHGPRCSRASWSRSYPVGKRDLYSAFVVRCLTLVAEKARLRWSL